MFTDLLLYLALIGAPIQALLEQAGSNSYRDREAASAQLESLVLDEATSPWVRDRLRAACQHPDPEVARRAGIALGRFYNVRPTNYPVLPWIDQLPKDFARREEVIHDCLRQAAGTEGWPSTDWPSTEWPRFRAATAVLTVKLLDAGMTRKCVVQLLDRMAADEARWRKAVGLPPLS